MTRPRTPPALVIVVALAICTLLVLAAIADRRAFSPVRSSAMSTTYAAIINALRDEPAGLTAQEVAAKLGVPRYRANSTLSKLGCYGYVNRYRDANAPGNAFRYSVKEDA